MSDNSATPDSQLVLMPQPQAPVVGSYRSTGHLKRRTILDLTPHEFERLQFMAKVYAASTFNSKTAQSEGDFFLIMMKGLELGISPMAAVDTINIISGKPVLDAKGMLALVKSSGLLEDILIDSTSERCIVTIKRVGNTEQIVSFTMEDAKRFKTYEKGGWIALSEKSNWKSQPTVMLKWRAVTSAMREVFPDVIAGLYTPEELDSDTMVHDDGSMEIISTPVLETSTSKKSQTENHPVSPRAKKLDETTAWHQESGNLAKALGHCIAKGWIEGTTIAEQLASFASLVRQEITSFETGKSAIEAAEAAATNHAGKTPWDTFEGTQEIVAWAKQQGHEDSEPALLKLLNVSDWKVFSSAQAAKDAIAAATAKKESGKLSDEDLFAIEGWTKANFNILPSVLAERVDLSKCSAISTAKTLIKGVAREQVWPVVTEKVNYVVKKDNKGIEKKSLRFETVLGELSYFKGRTELIKLVGETYATDNGIAHLPDNEEQEIEPLLLTWKGRENYIEVVDALPIMEPEPAF